MKRKKHIFLKIFLTFILVFIIVFIGFAIYINGQISKEIDLSLIRTGASSITKIYYFDRDNGEINLENAKELKEEEIFLQKSEWCSYYDMPRNIKNAFIAVEDRRFFEHKGVDWLRTAKATLNYIFNFDKSGYGGSTITQQLIKNLTGDNKATPKRKLEEIFRAINLEKKLGKNEILELYLNVVYLSNNCYGVGAASELYFGKNVADLSLAECASLACIVKNPSKYDPYNNPENNLKRRNTVLSLMLEQGMITDDEYKEAVSEKVSINSSVKEEKSSGVYSWYTEALIDDIVKDLINKYDLSKEGAYMMICKGGLNIYSAIDPEIQKRASEVFENYTSYILPQSDGSYPEASCVIIDPYTSDILALVGGKGKKSANRIFNRATNAKRPLGSVIKPLSVYAPAIENKIINYATVYDDTPILYDETKNSYWPSNSPNVYRGLVNINYAIEHSINTVSVKTLNDLGIENSYNFLKDRYNFSLSENDKSEAPLALGQLTNGETLIKTANAYTAFANGGTICEPRTYLYVTDNYGNVLLSKETNSQRIFSKETASIMNIMLQNVVKNGTAKGAYVNNEGIEIAGKTGTSSNNMDKWFVGYSPYYVCGIWVGYDTPRSMSYSQNPAISYFNAIMPYAHKEKDNASLFLSGDVVEAEFCVDSGKKPCDDCKLDPRLNRIQKGYFINGTQPQDICQLHKSVYIDSESGLLANEQTSYLSRRKIALIDYEREDFLNRIDIFDKRYLISSRYPAIY